MAGSEMLNLLLKTSFIFFWIAINTKAEKFMSVNLAKERLKLAEECKNKPNGLYALPNAFRYVECIDGVATYKKCPRQKIFVPTCWECLDHFPSQLAFFCEERASESAHGKEVKYQHPWDCRSWITCNDGTPREHPCRGGKMFDTDEQMCVKNSKSCTLAPVTSLPTHLPFLQSELPKKINAAFVWLSDNIVLMDGSTYSVYDENDGRIAPGFPLSIDNEIPENVDAALSLPDKKIYYFKGDEFWLWGSMGYPKKIAEEWSGIPNDLDSAFYWTHTNKAYFFKGKNFFRYDIEQQTVDPGYPKEISKSWPGAMPGIDAAVGLKNGTIFLFKGRKHFTFNPPFCKADSMNIYANIARFRLASDD